MQGFSVTVSEMGSQALIRSTERPGFESGGRSGIIHRELVNEETDLIDVFHIRREDFDKVPFIGKGFGEDPAADDLATTVT